MNDARWQRTIDLFHAALERDAAEREAFLRAECADDAELYREVSSLVEADAAHQDGTLEQAAQAAAASWVGREAPADVIGQRIGRYQIVAHLGSGGMGDVYRATDTALGRDVALKLLGARLHSDATLRRRLELEARAASSLNHPNIVTVHEIGQADGFDFVVSELVDGETLRSRIVRGPSTLAELIDVGTQVAAALAAAHAAGIVHRDIKPENVMIRRDGLVKVVDFGLAKSAARDDAKEKLSTHEALTQAGAVAGTSCYMSPEQALGETIDHRSDLFALGIVLYETITARRPFTGPTDAAMYEALVHTSPLPPTALRPGLPEAVDAVIGRALEKDRDLRYQSAKDLAADLKRLQRPLSGSPLAAAPAAGSRRTRRRAWIAAAVLLLAAAAVAVIALRPGAEARSAVRFTIGPPPRADFTLTGTAIPAVTLAISPDGRRVIFLAGEANTRGQLWVRTLDSLDAVPLDGTDGATFPFWSADGASIGFFARNGLHVKNVAGGAVRTVVAAAPGARGGTWNRDGVILFGTAEGPVFRVSAGGGTPSPVTALDEAGGESWHRFPQFLPDGDHFLYLARAGDTRTLVVGSLSGTKQRVIETAVRGTYAPPGYLLTIEDDVLMARPFDTRRLAVTGEPTAIAPYVATSSANDASFAVSATGVLVYAGRAPAASQPTWFDRAGRVLGTTGIPSQYLSLRLSPDEKTVAVSRAAPGERAPDIWLLDVERNAESRFTSNKWLDVTPVWAPDGRTILFASSRTGRYRIYQRAAHGGPEEQLFFKSEESVLPEDWSGDGKFVVYGETGSIGLLDVPATRAATLVTSRFRNYEARISPDGHWIAYTSDETGRPEVYVRAFPAGGATVLVSTGGGSEPAWRRDGREIFFVAPGGTLMSVDITVSNGVIAPSTPRRLFQAQMPAALQRDGARYAVTGDGQRFLVNVLTAKESSHAMTVVVDWPRDLRR
jgi:eukaryotic-like serine/threonine-protein kinase